MVKLVDTLDLKSSEQQCSCGFKSRSEYKTRNENYGFFCGYFRLVFKFEKVSNIIWYIFKNGAYYTNLLFFYPNIYGRFRNF